MKSTELDADVPTKNGCTEPTYLLILFTKPLQIYAFARLAAGSTADLPRRARHS
jgi:hypothetical protein